MHFKLHFQIPELWCVFFLLSNILCKWASTSFFSSTQTKKHYLQKYVSVYRASWNWQHDFSTQKREELFSTPVAQLPFYVFWVLGVIQM